MQTEYITTNEAAEIARVTPTTIRAWLKSGRLRGVKFGQQWLTRQEWINALAGEYTTEEKDEELERRAEAALARLEILTTTETSRGKQTRTCSPTMGSGTRKVRQRELPVKGQAPQRKGALRLQRLLGAVVPHHQVGNAPRNQILGRRRE